MFTVSKCTFSPLVVVFLKVAPTGPNTDPILDPKTTSELFFCVGVVTVIGGGWVGGFLASHVTNSGLAGSRLSG